MIIDSLNLTFNLCYYFLELSLNNKNIFYYLSPPTLPHHHLLFSTLTHHLYLDFIKSYEQMVDFIIIDDIGFVLCDNLRLFLILIWDLIKS